MTALIHFHYKDFSLKVTGCKKELKVRGQVNRIQNSPVLPDLLFHFFLRSLKSLGRVQVSELSVGRSIMQGCVLRKIDGSPVL